MTEPSVRYRVRPLRLWTEAELAECWAGLPQQAVDYIRVRNTLRGLRERTQAYLMLVDLLREAGLWRGYPIVEPIEKGKPVLTGGYQGVDFNVSHCREAVAVAVATGCRVGIDVEGRRVVSRPLAERVCSADEWAALCRSADFEWDFLRLWTRKEAALKCTGRGIGGFASLREAATLWGVEVQEVPCGIEGVAAALATRALPSTDGV